MFNLALLKTAIVTLGFSPDGSTLCVFGQDEERYQNYLWRVPSLKEIASQEQSTGP